MGIALKVSGAKKLERTFAGLGKEIREEMQNELKVAAFEVRNTAIRKISQGNPRGHWYGKHHASAPGQPPATDSGDLVKSIEVKVVGMNAYVFTEEDHGAYMEFGTQYIAERPWLKPSLDENEANVPSWARRATMKGAEKAKRKGGN